MDFSCEHQQPGCIYWLFDVLSLDEEVNILSLQPTKRCIRCFNL